MATFTAGTTFPIDFDSFDISDLTSGDVTTATKTQVIVTAQEIRRPSPSSTGQGSPTREVTI